MLYASTSTATKRKSGPSTISAISKRTSAVRDRNQTTIGQTVYVTADWDDRAAEQRYVTMRHELVHMRQFRRYTLPGMAFLYLLVPLPLGLAWFRARFEKEAYAESIRAWAEVFGPAYPRRPEIREHVLRQFTSGSYGWMWPFPRAFDRWFDEAMADIRAEAS